MKKNSSKAEAKKQIDEFLKKGGRVYKCPIKVAKNCVIMGMAGTEYLKQQKLKQPRRQNV